ncbi:hypothetical protein ABW16_21485 [Mycolicibacter heraklionensis]|uniref:Zinc finger LSD1-type domain-containing protein n=1 Tax=Mycolicibacter heraklionensis TaxID=512402 RepID=A0ABR5FA07_9MYCO|nr:hypothetical protein [Mycolicibacter heraklionensis]KLO25888.1 hypothetical protein ABW16_21485 [Mycolicibacter heraklionensis]
MTQTQCLRCEAQAQQFLCRDCTRQTRATLRGLPRLLRHLAEAAVGQTRLGDIGRHTPYRSRHELDGESDLASHIEPLPDGESDLYEARRARERAALRKLLAAGGVNERASTLHSDIVNMLTTWIRDICEARGVDAPSLDAADPAGLCAWLSRHTDAIANHPAADEFCDELNQRVGQTLRIINRPQTHMYCGLCPAELTDNYGTRICNRELMAPRGASEVQCPACKTTHSVDELCERKIETVNDEPFTIEELVDTVLPMIVREYIPSRTLQHWAATGKLVPTGYDNKGNPRFLLSDVRKLREGRTCSAEGCGRKHHSNGLCDTHRKRRERVVTT